MNDQQIQIIMEYFEELKPSETEKKQLDALLHFANHTDSMLNI